MKVVTIRWLLSMGLVETTAEFCVESPWDQLTYNVMKK